MFPSGCGTEGWRGAGEPPAARGRAGMFLGDPCPLHPEPGAVPLFPSGGSRAPGALCRAARRDGVRDEPRKLPVRCSVCKTLRCRSAGRQPRLCSALSRAELPAPRPSGTTRVGPGESRRLHRPARPRTRPSAPSRNPQPGHSCVRGRPAPLPASARGRRCPALRLSRSAGIHPRLRPPLAPLAGSSAGGR